MEMILMVLGLVSLIILLLTSIRKYMGIKAVLLVILMITAAVVVIYNTVKSDDVHGADIISSFFSAGSEQGTMIPLIKNEEENEIPEWRRINSDLADIQVNEHSFMLKPVKNCIWFEESDAPMVFRKAEGNFLFSSGIRTRKFSDSLKYPDNDLQLGGIIIRSPLKEGSGENYIIISVGYTRKGLHLEVNSTVENRTSASYYEWTSGDAELMIQREAGVFGLFARPYGTGASWKKVQVLHRPDFPQILQAGITAYSYPDNGDHDFVVYFEDIQIRNENE